MTYAGPNMSDMVEVAESWHLPSEPGAADGLYLSSPSRRYTICRGPPSDCSRFPIEFVPLDAAGDSRSIRGTWTRLPR